MGGGAGRSHGDGATLPAAKADKAPVQGRTKCLPTGRRESNYLFLLIYLFFLIYLYYLKVAKQPCLLTEL